MIYNLDSNAPTIEETIKSDQYSQGMRKPSAPVDPNAPRKFHIGIVTAYSKDECYKFANKEKQGNGYEILLDRK